MDPALASYATPPAAIEAPPRPPVPAVALRLLSDERLARLASAGDRAAFAAIFARYHQELYRYCVSLLRDPEDAADALQSAMLRALRSLQGEGREINLRPWLYRIAHNESITLMRRRPRAELQPEPIHAASRDVESNAAMRAQLADLVNDLRQLPERQRGALVMRELAGLDYPEIAAALDTSPAAAKQATYEARCALLDLAKGRDMGCDSVRSMISGGDRRQVRGRGVRAHLRACPGCREFQTAIGDRRARLAALAPALPPAAAGQILNGVLAGGSGAGAGAGVLAVLGSTAAIKSLSAVVIAGVVGAAAFTAMERPATEEHPAAAKPVPGAHAHPARNVTPATAHAKRAQPARHATHKPHARGSATATPHARARHPGPTRSHASTGGAAATPSAPTPQPTAAEPNSRGPLPSVRVPEPVRQEVHTVSDTAGSVVGGVQETAPLPTLPVPKLP